MIGITCTILYKDKRYQGTFVNTTAVAAYVSETAAAILRSTGTDDNTRMEITFIVDEQ